MKLGKTSIELSPVTLGLWQAGNDMWAYHDDATMVEVIKTAIDQGITSIDTAQAYGEGHAERLLGNAVRGCRDHVVLASKVIKALSYQEVLDQCHASLQRLNTDFMDLYYIHWPSGSFGEPAVPMAETFKALNELKDAGKIRAIGVSNFSLEQLKQAQQYAQIDAVQNPFSIVWQRDINTVLPYCLAEDISYFSYSSLAGGLLSGKYRNETELMSQPLRGCYNVAKPDVLPRLLALLEQLDPMAAQYHTSIANLAIAWLVHLGINAIVGASKPEQVMANAQAGALSLAQNDVETLVKLGAVVSEAVDADTLLDAEGLGKLKKL